MKTDFKNFQIGTVFNKTKLSKKIEKQSNQVSILYPARLNGMAINPGLIATNKNLVYTPGEVVFSIDIMTKVKISVVTDNDEIKVSENSKRKSLILHAATIMKHAINFSDGLFIEVENQNEIKHAGLGSSSGLIAGVASAINELYGNPIASEDLIKYCAQNHGEEVDNDQNSLSPVQCIGGSAASILHPASVLILAGESTVVGSCSLNDDFSISIAIPNDYVPKDGEELMKLEEQNFSKFIKTGEEYSKEIAYRMFHEVLPPLKSNNISTLGKLVYDYRFFMGSIDNCSFVFERSLEIKQAIIDNMIYKDGDIIGLSSVGPSYFMISKDVAKFNLLMSSLNMRILNVKPHNNKYIVL